jgi:NAD+ kinase
LGNARLLSHVKRIGILYHPQLEKARELADKIQDLLSSHGVCSWKCSAWDEDEAKTQAAGSDLILSIGGDGTILHVSRLIVPLAVPLLGINLGNLGFITELQANEVFSDLPAVITDGGWVEERAMLQAQLGDKSFYALNDVVVRSTTVSLVNITAEIDGELLTTYRADGLIVATATGSTAYSLATGGPILHPQSKEIVLQPISCHLGLNRSLVIPQQSVVSLKVADRDKAILSADGQINFPISGGQTATLRLSPHTARFLRSRKPTYFYGTLWQKLKGNNHER